MQIESKQRHIWITLTRIKEIIIYINTFWPKNNQSEPEPSEELKTFNNRQCKLKGQAYWITNGKMYVSPELVSSVNQQTIKLKNVDSLLRFFDTTLEEITKDIQNIYENILIYENNDDSPQNDAHLNEKVHLSQKFAKNKRQYKETVIFGNIFKFINQCLLSHSFNDILNKSPQQFAIMLLSIQTKLSVLPNMIDSASTFQSDITTSLPFIDKYEHAWKNIHFIQMQDVRQSVRQQICRLKKLMKITTSAVVNEITSFDVQLVKKVVFGLSFPYFWLADEQSELKCYKIWRNPKVQYLNHVWNLPQNGAIKHCKKILFPSIKTSLFIYVPSDYREVKKNFSYIQNTHIDYQPQIFQEPQNLNDYIRISVLYYGRLNFHLNFRKYEPFCMFPCLNIANENDLDTIIIHFHGGGFVALSSETSQSYTRKWANELKIPVFSVDYRKPPKYRFPTPLQDCLTAYQFIVQNIHKYFKIRPKRIILAGDSAGGNLSVSLQALLMQKNYPVKPLGIFLAYPAVDLRVKFSPSRLNSFDDPILIPPLLFLCLRQYLGENEENQQNPLASPILLSQNFIKKGLNKTDKEQFQQSGWPKLWPQTTIMVGKKDPLYDDSLRLVQKMSKSGVNVKMLIYNQFSHAFLSLDSMIPLCSRAIDDSVLELRKFINF